MFSRIVSKNKSTSLLTELLQSIEDMFFGLRLLSTKQSKSFLDTHSRKFQFSKRMDKESTKENSNVSSDNSCFKALI